MCNGYQCAGDGLCNSNGACVNSVCVCDNDHFGVDCLLDVCPGMCVCVCVCVVCVCVLCLCVVCV